MKTLLLIDGHALAYREYFALERTAMSTSDNQPTWAIYGFFKAIFDLLKNKKIKPDAIAVTFDVSRHSFRTEKFKEYKAKREAMPDNMRSQMGLIQEGLKAFDIPIYTKEGFEADDVIGTISKKATELGHKTYILTGDKDSFQLIDKEGTISVLIPSKGELTEYNWNTVYEKMGVYPNQIIDFKALRGDDSDNIPGIKGIGDKTAQKLLKEYSTLENVFKHASEIRLPSIRTKIMNGEEIATLSRDLATIIRDVDIDFDFEKACIELPDIMKVSDFFQKVQFYSFIKNIDKIMQLFNVPCNSPKKNVVKKVSENTQLGLFSKTLEYEINKENHNFKNIEIEPKEFAEILNNHKSFSLCIDALENDNSVISAIAVGITDFNTIKVYSIPINSNLRTSLEILKPIFENSSIRKLLHNGKLEYTLLKKYGITLKNVEFDTLLASYVKDPIRQHDIRTQALEHIKFILAEDNDIRERAYAIIKLTHYWESVLDEKELKLVKEVEVPLSLILSEMELSGVLLDKKYLKNLAAEYTKKIEEVSEIIFKAARKTFNLNSPKQVAEALYSNCRVREIKKKNKFDTSAEMLEELSEKYKVCKRLLEYRKYSKLLSTYALALPNLISSEDGKIHTSFNQTTTATGRLSSSNPNLQNIPVRSEDGIKIRKAFIPENQKTQVLLSADYSQIELRLLAHCSGDERLIRAFNLGEDVHTETASEIFNVPMEKVTKEMRRKAKAVNFGIVYGQSKYGLSKALGIEQKLAADFIDKYFETYPKVREYMENTVKMAHEKGYVETIFGRKRYLGMNLNSTNRFIRDAAERAAINQPLQGSAADLIKKAMITLYGRLTELGLKSKIILQVHDELIIETEIDELETVKAIVKDAMELNQPLKVPLVVNLAYGKNWVEL